VLPLSAVLVTTSVFIELFAMASFLFFE